MYQKLIIYVVGIYACFLTWGLTQERVSTNTYDGHKFQYFIFLNACQAAIGSVVAFIFLKSTSRSPDKLSGSLIWSLVKISVMGALASPFGYASLKHIDYPTLILGKSCKLVPVLLMNFLIFRKTFSLKKYIIVLLVTIGVSVFMLLDPKKRGSTTVGSSGYGISLLSINLLIDGAVNSSQDNIFKKFKISGTSMMLFMNIFQFILLLGFLILNPWSNELKEAIAFCYSNPAVNYDILLFSVAGSLGQCFIFLTLESFGSLTLVTVTVTRKMGSILLSVFWFGHSLAIGQWAAVALVFLAIGWEAFGKRDKPKILSGEEVRLDRMGHDKKAM